MESREDAMSNVLDRLDNKEDLELAKAAQRCLVSALDHSRAVQIAVLEEGAQDLGDAPLLRLPPNVLRLFADVLGTLAQGKAVTVMPKEHDVTTQEAAMYLNMSRAYLVRLLEAGKIPHHKVGTHRRLRFEDVVQYKDERKRRSQQALQALADQAQELELGY
ncbi:helix-turn-helix domain-containing protein [Janthinobacterium agaricidamnosum]|uniref:Helix-turn-helix domain-containing protein n=2 Tax=Janthinobacterium agaricidamnosum TaxID=55508 RepID=A0A3G2EFV5_9BURK|nr:helix-turn-helix domain-containing protein [Janthinobacterium agaricidamnosum]